MASAERAAMEAMVATEAVASPAVAVPATEAMADLRAVAPVATRVEMAERAEPEEMAEASPCHYPMAAPEPVLRIQEELAELVAAVAREATEASMERQEPRELEQLLAAIVAAVVFSVKEPFPALMVLLGAREPAVALARTDLRLTLPFEHRFLAQIQIATPVAISRFLLTAVYTRGAAAMEIGITLADAVHPQI